MKQNETEKHVFLKQQSRFKKSKVSTSASKNIEIHYNNRYWYVTKGSDSQSLLFWRTKELIKIEFYCKYVLFEFYSRIVNN